jgi:phosphoribosylformylglycinamidine cyclo-ligase
VKYVDAGVDVDEGNRAVALIKPLAARTHGAQVLGGLGGFSGLFAFPAGRYRAPVLVATTDGVGTKVKLAAASGRHGGIGVDLVNHCVNDLITTGAEPLFFLDYFATGLLRAEHLKEVVEGMVAACTEAGCALLGGETAEMPDVYASADYDVAGFLVGAVERDEILDGARVAEGDAILALPSSGLHTNGFSLARRILAGQDLSAAYPGGARPLLDDLLMPHRSYLREVRTLRELIDIKALAHITGGGVIENLPRTLPAGLGAEIQPGSWPIPALFTYLQQQGRVPEAEMWRTFNMGLGMLVITDPVGARRAPFPQVGRVVRGAGVEFR